MSSSILINTPDIKNSGGIANFYQSLAPHFSEKVLYNTITFFPDKSPSFIQQIGLYSKFFIKMLGMRGAVFMVNPSFNYKSVRRDWIYLFIASFFAKKRFVFWHGWDEAYYHNLLNKKIGKYLFRRVYGACAGHFVLATDFKFQLENLGINSQINLATTCVDDNLLNALPIGLKIAARQKVKDLLFISRIEEDKGIFQTLEAFSILEKHFPELNLAVAGSGGSLQEAKDYAETLKIKNVKFLGYVRGEDKARLLANSDVLLFPTFHGEGLPLTLLEAMRFGMVIATTMMGGIKDIYRPLMGPKLEIKSVDSIIAGIRSILNDQASVKEMSEHNLQYVQSHFLASSVAKQLESKLSEA